MQVSALILALNITRPATKSPHKDHRRDFLDRSADLKRGAADDADHGLTVLGGPQPGDIARDDKVVPAARLEFDEFHESVS